MLMPAAFDLLDQVRWLFGPHERGRMVIPRVDVAMDVGHERAHRIEGSAADRLARQNAEPDFDEVQPRGTSRREMKLHGRMRLQPRAHGGRGMDRRIVENYVKGMAAVSPVHELEKLEEFGRRVPRLADPDDMARAHVEGRIEARQTVATIVMRPTRGQAR